MIVGFGDSVPAGGGGCYTNFVSEYVRLLDQTPLMYNHSVSGSTSIQLLELINKSSTIQEHLSKADVALIMTGANDYNVVFDAARKSGDFSDYDTVASQLDVNVSSIIQVIKRLNSKIKIVLFGYWACMLDGKVASKEYDDISMKASLACTKSANDAIVAAKSDCIYISTYDVFYNGDYPPIDITDLLQPDGNHPNAFGHRNIAAKVFKEIFEK